MVALVEPEKAAVAVAVAVAVAAPALVRIPASSQIDLGLTRQLPALLASDDPVALVETQDHHSPASDVAYLLLADVVVAVGLLVPIPHCAPLA